MATRNDPDVKQRYVVDLDKIKGLPEWQKARRTIESTVSSAIGPLPKSTVELQVKAEEDLEYPGFLRRRITYFVDDWSRVSAWLFIPEGREEMPAILCCHQQTAQGKDEPAGLNGDPMLAFARHYAEQGYVTLAPDCVTAGERVSGGLEPFDTTSMYKDHPKVSAIGKMLADHMRCLDILAELEEVDPSRIGVVGHGMGAYNALFLTAFDERIQVCVASCGFTTFSADDDPERWAREEGFVLLPKLRKPLKSKQFSFDWDHILGLLAPSPTLLVTALNDEELPNTKSCGEAAKRVKKLYKMFGAAHAIQDIAHKNGRGMSVQGLASADAWFDRWL